MKSILFLCFLTLNSSLWSCEKDSMCWGVSSSFSMTNLDFFVGFQALNVWDRWSFGLGLETGVNRTIFQQRFFPKVSVIGNFTFFRRPWVNIFISGNYALSVCKINQSTDSFHYWNEVYSGLGLEFGRRFRPFLCASTGLLHESFRNKVQNKLFGFNTLGFQGTIGLKYVF